jgi:hypothetical protein
MVISRRTNHKIEAYEYQIAESRSFVKIAIGKNPKIPPRKWMNNLTYEDITTQYEWQYCAKSSNLRPPLT